MNNLARLSSSNPQQLAKVYDLEKLMLACPQSDIVTDHLIHGGMYARTITLPAGIVLTGALIKIPTMVIINGSVSVHVGEDKPIYLNGYNVAPALSNRKTAFHAYTDTQITMIFPTTAQTTQEAEAEFTDDAPLLMSRKEGAINHITITGE